MEQKGRKKSDGREWEIWSGSISELHQLIPTFTILDFRVGAGINKYKSVIVREPYGAVDIGDEVDSMKSLRIPIEVVRKQHEGVVWDNYIPKNVLLGYSLVQHHDLLDRVLKTLKKFSKQATVGIAKITPLTEPESIEATLEISIYGARMRIEFLVCNYKYNVDNGKPYVLKVVCRNSMDKRIAVEVNLYLYREDSPNIPFRAFYSRHNPEELKDGEIEKRLNDRLTEIANGSWRTATADKETVENLIRNNFSKKWVEQILIIVNRSDKAKSNRINLYWFRIQLSKLFMEAPKLELPDQQTMKILNLFSEIDKVLDEETEKSGEQQSFNQSLLDGSSS